jgi:purine nucleoside permease
MVEIDAREIPEDWPYGIIPLGGAEAGKGGRRSLVRLDRGHN